MTEIYLELLDDKRKETFLKLKPLADKGGVLAGGTALFLQIKGRRSFDFDIFFNKHVVRKAFSVAKRIFEIKEEIVNKTNHITFLTKDDIRVALFRYPFQPLYPLVKTKSLSLFSIRDLAADKAHTLGHRPAWRDYVDLFFLLKDEHVTLENIIKDAKKKFQANFAPKLFLEQLTYYGDIKNFKVEFVDQKYSPEEIQKFLKKNVTQYAKKYLGIS